MAKKKNGEYSTCSQKYGVPSYSAAWVPTNNIFDKQKPMENDEQDSELSSLWLVFCGGGGEGRSGIPNSLLLAQFDSNSLSPNLNGNPSILGEMVLSVHFLKVAGVKGFCKNSEVKLRQWFEWDVPEFSEKHQVDLKSSEKMLTQLEDVGQQVAMTFSTDGSALAVGGEVCSICFDWRYMLADC
ncbi:hypothetical protein IFM89_035898 [Coptis chinensis]|uniref:Uncharacterized protein n=1 Tax=Coptis chinensis TaxID=261450 RepID=A0A835H1Q5_9MAGN|nr:hypothetical protein IFM89_035898 [Coptis chinensis]